MMEFFRRSVSILENNDGRKYVVNHHLFHAEEKGELTPLYLKPHTVRVGVMGAPLGDSSLLAWLLQVYAPPDLTVFPTPSDPLLNTHSSSWGEKW